MKNVFKALKFSLFTHFPKLIPWYSQFLVPEMSFTEVTNKGIGVFIVLSLSFEVSEFELETIIRKREKTNRTLTYGNELWPNKVLRTELSLRGQERGWINWLGDKTFNPNWWISVLYNPHSKSSKRKFLSIN